MRWRVTVRGDSPRVELRGYLDGEHDRLVAFSEAMKPYGLVMASPADPGYDPFRAPQQEGTNP